MKRQPPLLGLLGGLLAVYLAAPFAAGLLQTGAADWHGADLAGLAAATGVSVVSSTLATAFIALGGIPLGYLLAHGRGRGLAVLGFVVQLPLALPPLTSGVLLLFLFGYSGPLGALRLTDSFPAIVLAETFVAAPFLVIAARSAFAAADPALEDVAASLGHGPGAVFRRVSLPLAMRPILAGLLLAWLRAFGEFGATVMMAYHPYSLPVYTYIAFGSEGLPAMLPVLAPTLLAAVAMMALSQGLRAPQRRPAEPAALPALPPPALLSPAVPPAPAVPLEVAARRRLPGFALAVAWRSTARRLAILGPSGSGKSLTLRVIAGLGEVGESTVRFAGRDLGRLPPQQRGIAYVPQNYGLFPHLTVAEQVRFGVGADPALAAAWTVRLGLSGLEGRHPAELSLGQQQRVALARALACMGARTHVGLLLLDEPFSALDTPLRLRLRRDMRALQAGLAATTILVTHDPAEAMELADELLLLEAGRVLQSGPVAEVFARPASAAVARLLGAELLGAGRALAPDALDIGAGVVLRVAGAPLPTGQRMGWAVRPQQLRLGTAGDYPAEILARGPVADGRRRVRLRLGAAVLESLADPGCPPEGSCRVSLDPAALQVWPEPG